MPGGAHPTLAEGVPSWADHEWQDGAVRFPWRKIGVIPGPQGEGDGLDRELGPAHTIPFIGRQSAPRAFFIFSNHK